MNAHSDINGSAKERAELSTDPDPNKALWQAVLARGIEDAAGRIGARASRWSKSAEVKRARDWIGSRDFAFVCDLAGMDPDFVAAAFRRGCFDQPQNIRGRKYASGAKP